MNLIYDKFIKCLNAKSAKNLMLNMYVGYVIDMYASMIMIQILKYVKYVENYYAIYVRKD